VKKRLVTLLILAVVLALVGWQVYIRLTAAAATGQRPGAAMAVAVAPVHKGAILDVQVFTGSLLPKSQFVVSPKIAGRLEKLLVDIGDEIKSGQLLAELDSAEYAREVEQAKAEFEVARATVEECRSTLDESKRAYDRVVALREKQIASASELDAAEGTYRRAQARRRVAEALVDQRDAALKAAEIRLSYTRIGPDWPDADQPRIVGERYADAGQLLKANDPIVSLLDIRTLTGVINVTERDYPRLRIGQPAEITTDAFPQDTFTGRIARIAPLVRETSREARVEVEIANADLKLKPGMFVRARIEFGRHDNAALVPSDAIVRRNDRQGLFAADLAARKARFVPVTLGIVQGDRTEILEPEIRDPIVVTGQHLLEDGTPILIPEKRAPENGPPAAGPAEAPPPQAQGSKIP